MIKKDNINFSKKELKNIRECVTDIGIIHKINKFLNEGKLSHTYTQYVGPEGKFSKKFETSDLAYEFLKSKLGEWSSKTADSWAEYEFFDVENGKELGGYTY